MKKRIECLPANLTNLEVKTWVSISYSADYTPALGRLIDGTRQPVRHLKKLPKLLKQELNKQDPGSVE